MAAGTKDEFLNELVEERLQVSSAEAPVDRGFFPAATKATSFESTE